jgi:hypothetical protein
MKLNLYPAYGRSYNNAESALLAWNQGKDFLPYNGELRREYINKQDFEQYQYLKTRYTEIEIFYQNNPYKSVKIPK